MNLLRRLVRLPRRAFKRLRKATRERGKTFRAWRHEQALKLS